VGGEERPHAVAELVIHPARLGDECVALVRWPVERGVEQLIDLTKPLA
jgi:hypothetical protein